MQRYGNICRNTGHFYLAAAEPVRNLKSHDIHQEIIRLDPLQCIRPSGEFPWRRVPTCCALYIASALMVKRKAAMRLARIDSARMWYYSGQHQPQTVKLSKVSVRWYGEGRKPYQMLILCTRYRHRRREPGAARCCESQRQARARDATLEMQTQKAAPTVAVYTLTSYGGQHHEVWAHV
jgi:hypothetical protein